MFKNKIKNKAYSSVKKVYRSTSRKQTCLVMVSCIKWSKNLRPLRAGTLLFL